MAILGRNGSCGCGQRNADPASLQPSREGTRGMNASASISSHLQAPASHWPNPTQEGRAGAQVMQPHGSAWRHRAG